MRVYNKHCSTIAGIHPGRIGEISEDAYWCDPWAFVIEPDQNGSASPSDESPPQTNETGSGADKPPRRAQNRQSPAPSSDV